MLEGLIIRGVGGFYYVETESGVYQCRARGLFKKQGITPMVGDHVAIDLTEEEEVEGYVTEIHPRRNSFIRPPIANVDLLLVTAAFRHPAPNLRLIDRFLVMAQMAGTEAVICFNKSDLADAAQIEEMQRIYGSSYEVRFLSAKTGDGIDALAERVAGLQVALAGPSGVGKSTVLNHLCRDASAKTGEVSRKTRRGRHTTRHVEIFPMDLGMSFRPSSQIQMPKIDSARLISYGTRMSLMKGFRGKMYDALLSKSENEKIRLGLTSFLMSVAIHKMVRFPFCAGALRRWRQRRAEGT